MIDGVEERRYVGGCHVLTSMRVEISNPGDGGVYGSMRTMWKAAMNELVFDNDAKMETHSGLEDSVSD